MSRIEIVYDCEHCLHSVKAKRAVLVHESYFESTACVPDDRGYVAFHPNCYDKAMAPHRIPARP